MNKKAGRLMATRFLSLNYNFVDMFLSEIPLFDYVHGHLLSGPEAEGFCALVEEHEESVGGAATCFFGHPE